MIHTQCVSIGSINFRTTSILLPFTTMKICCSFPFFMIFLSLGSGLFLSKPRYIRNAGIPHSGNIFHPPYGELNENHRNTNNNSQRNFVASIILNSIDKSADPCENFYDYACGNWKKYYSLPDDKNIWDLSNILEQDINIRLKDILEEEIKPNDSIALQHEKLWYKSCTDLENLEKTGIKPLQNMLNNAGGWPLSMESEWNNQHLWQEIHKYYMIFKDINGAIFDIRVSHDVRNTSKYIISLDQPSDTFYESMLRDKKNIELISRKYENFMKKIAIIFAKSNARNVPVNKIEKDVRDVMNFEKQLHLIKSTVHDRADFEWTQNYMSIRELQKYYDEEYHKNDASKIDWLDTFKYIFNQVNVSITDTEEIQVLDKLYMKRLSNLLDKVPNRVIVNYIHWKFLIYSIEYTTEEMISLAVEMALEHRGFKKLPERWLTCLIDIKPRAGFVHKYINKYFSEDTKETGFKMSETIRGEMLNLVRQSSWLDNPTKMKTINKLNKISVRMGFSSALNNATILAHVYDKLQMESNYFENVMNYRKYEMTRDLGLLRQYDKKDPEKVITMDPLELNAFYDLYTNLFFVTAAQLSTPFSGPSVPISMNYGYLGFIIGHEITHAVDNDGRLYTANGNVETWWPESMIREYKKRSQCFIDHYNNYSIDGKVTLNENIADTVGMQISYNALKKRFSNVEDIKLHGLENLKPEQLFFISFAMNYCASVSPQYLIEYANDEHSPRKYRTIGTLSNLDAFADAFDCPPGSPMNPTNKCHLWE